MDTDEILSKARRCLAIEIKALEDTADAIDSRFSQVAERLHEVLAGGNKLIFSGIGKSAHIAHKLVGTFNSIGATASFLDPVNALHGDLGHCRQGDAVLALSNKGETEEVLRFISMVKRFEVTTVAITSVPGSSLARLCDLILPYSVSQEACPLDLAPTASTTATMAIGDALAMVLLEMRALSKEDFAQFHPGGSIGRSLAPSVDQIMRRDDRFPCLPQTSACRQCLALMTRLKSGCIALVDDKGVLAGVFSDGDLRRKALQMPDFLEQPISSLMTRHPITIRSGSLAGEALKILEHHSIDDLIVVDDDNRPIGIIDGQDLPKVRVV